MGIAAKIWMGVGVIIAGVVLTVAIGYVQSRHSEASISQVQNALFPASILAYQAETAYMTQLALYESAVLQGEKGPLAEAGKAAANVTQRLDEILTKNALPTRRLSEASILRRDCDSANLATQVTYRRMAGGEVNDKLLAESARLSKQADELKKRFSTLTAGLGEDLRGALDNVATVTAIQRRTNLIALLGVLAVSWLVVAAVITRSVTRPLREMVSRLRDIAGGEGDLTQRLQVERRRDEIGELGRWFNTFVDKLQEIIRGVARITDVLARSSSNASSSSHEISDNLQSVASGTLEMTESMKTISTNSGEAARVAADAVRIASGASEWMSRLRTSSSEIGEVVKSISSIAAKINLLALNASIEAARAGSAGSGAVAQRTSRVVT